MPGTGWFTQVIDFEMLPLKRPFLEQLAFSVKMADQLGITMPADLLGRDPYALYDDLCRITGQRHDPCLLDTFIAAIRYMAGELKQPWRKYTAERTQELAARTRSEGNE